MLSLAGKRHGANGYRVAWTTSVAKVCRNRLFQAAGSKVGPWRTLGLPSAPPPHYPVTPLPRYPATPLPRFPIPTRALHYPITLQPRYPACQARKAVVEEQRERHGERWPGGGRSPQWGSRGGEVIWVLKRQGCQDTRGTLAEPG